MKFLMASLIFLFSVSVFCQTDYSSIDRRVTSYPKFTSATELSQKIQSDFKSDPDRTRALFTWIATNITYDLNEAKSGSQIAYKFSSPEDRQKKEFEFRTALVSKTMKTKKGVCEGYASVFVEVCRQMQIQAVIIPGTSRTHPSQIGKIPNWQDHAWNAVMLDGKWQLIDLTWAAGIVDTNTGKFRMEFNDGYFLTSPEDFFKNHFPDDPKWLLTDATATQFANQAFYFPTYFKGNFDVSLKHGMLKIDKPMIVEISIDGIDNRPVYFTLGAQTTLKPLKVENGKVQIPVNGRISGYLTLFVETKPIVAYKIRRN